MITWPWNKKKEPEKPRPIVEAIPTDTIVIRYQADGSIAEVVNGRGLILSHQDVHDWTIKIGMFYSRITEAEITEQRAHAIEMDIDDRLDKIEHEYEMRMLKREEERLEALERVQNRGKNIMPAVPTSAQTRSMPKPVFKPQPTASLSFSHAKIKRAPAPPSGKDRGWVYVMRAGEHVKIGKSAAPQSRLSSIQTGSAYQVEVLRLIETGNMSDLESRLHARFCEYCVRGEWFKLPDDKLDWLLTAEVS